MADLKPEERYIEDADDSSFEENTTATGAYAGPDYVEIPESRLSRFFNRFRKKPEPEEDHVAALPGKEHEIEFIIIYSKLTISF